MDEHGDSSAFGLLQIDFVNAFNNVSQSAILRVVDCHFPKLPPLAYLCYSPSTQPHLWSKAFHFRSVTGVQQGDPLGPLLFSIALQLVINEITDGIQRWNDEADAITPHTTRQMLFSFYMDDGILIGRHHVLFCA